MVPVVFVAIFIINEPVTLVPVLIVKRWLLFFLFLLIHHVWVTEFHIQLLTLAGVVLTIDADCCNALAKAFIAEIGNFRVNTGGDIFVDSLSIFEAVTKFKVFTIFFGRVGWSRLVSKLLS